MNDMTIPFDAPAEDVTGKPQALRHKYYGEEFRKVAVTALYRQLVDSCCDLEDVNDLTHPQVLSVLSLEAYRFIRSLEAADFLGYDSGYQLLNDIRHGLLGNIDARDHYCVAQFYRFGRSVLANGGVR